MPRRIRKNQKTIAQSRSSVVSIFRHRPIGAYTLVIVDMQKYFTASQSPRVMREVLKQIRMAMKRGMAIILVEYVDDENNPHHWRDFGPTDERITNLIGDYERVAVALKQTDEGGIEVLDACEDEGFYTGKFRVCGVNIDACVAKTVGELVHQSNEPCHIELVLKGCDTSNEYDASNKTIFKRCMLKLEVPDSAYTIV